MKNRTVYDVLDQVMKDYQYEIKKTGNRFEVKGSVFIPRVEITVRHEETFYTEKDDNTFLASKINKFKETLKALVASTIKEHEEELTDDEMLIDKLMYEIKSLKKKLSDKEYKLEKATEKIASLQQELLEKSYKTTPYTPYPWDLRDNATGVTWEPTVGDPIGWNDSQTSWTGPKANGVTAYGKY